MASKPPGGAPPWHAVARGVHRAGWGYAAFGICQLALENGQKAAIGSPTSAPRPPAGTPREAGERGEGDPGLANICIPYILSPLPFGENGNSVVWR